MRDGCPFCDYDGPSEVLMRFFDGRVYVIEPISPVVEGHSLVIPMLHVDDFTCWRVGPQSERAIRETFMAASMWATARAEDEHVNIISSRGTHATQTMGHLHVHVVPRRADDGLMLPWDVGSGSEWLGERADDCLDAATRLDP